MKYRKLKAGEKVRATDEVFVDEIGWVAGSLNTGKKLPGNKVGRYRRPLGKVTEESSYGKEIASALWRDLKCRQSNGLVPLRVDWIAVTEKRLNAAVAKVLKGLV